MTISDADKLFEIYANISNTLRRLALIDTRNESMIKKAAYYKRID